MIPEYLQRIYNTYLYISRTARGQPFRPRKDFDSFDESKAVFLTQINNMLTRYPHIKAESYFKAPYLLYPDTPLFELNYFASMKAVHDYTLYMKQLQELSPDDDQQINWIRDSLRQIGIFCIKNKLTLEQFVNYKIGATYEWAKWIKNHQISIYSIMELPRIYEKIQDMIDDEKAFLLGDLAKDYLYLKTKYLNSIKAKHLIQEGTKKIENSLISP